MVNDEDKFRLRYCFNAGSGVCLWAGNEAAERPRFQQAAREGLERLRRDLSPAGYELIDESTD
jgi:hypothetical protein